MREACLRTDRIMRTQMHATSKGRQFHGAILKRICQISRICCNEPWSSGCATRKLQIYTRIVTETTIIRDSGRFGRWQSCRRTCTWK